ncbi:GatB/YqeY domain-containing protein [Roseivirga pacifica]|uniref:GatB/YqeY domain-containing protein n=1 Tax=Roseivirga pacifica TaxID=1267423 RepID=UPI002096223B|nr:GatB/YqeY domain-containing protein [Roseivirga pacifica]MCO6359433.1 GatB/YqeY domain-containing protein [Roseivirga pacifica]MCO6366803.1 GatB/YqeY domain-containing protein [Roseivirga pacifica]MCO6370665.1 GatB/YqeY domain-containing protein [Roseivirga pacifica]MCO6374459.1 GatB/YqeY domain-containing protein [Roseivirga pacifica]MCO6379718.1 GatB/YqeY domain-containing protein [Roseivirga pacifica]
MSLKQQIEADIKKAMLAKEKEELKALRSVKSMIMLAETEKSKGTEISADDEMKLLMKAVKQRKDSAAIYKEQGREDLYAVEIGEAEIIERYLPKQLSEEEVKAELEKVIAQVGANGPQDMGKVMGVATKALAGKADGKTISTIVKSLLVG